MIDLFSIFLPIIIAFFLMLWLIGIIIAIVFFLKARNEIDQKIKNNDKKIAWWSLGGPILTIILVTII